MNKRVLGNQRSALLKKKEKRNTQQKHNGLNEQNIDDVPWEWGEADGGGVGSPHPPIGEKQMEVREELREMESGSTEISYFSRRWRERNKRDKCCQAKDRPQNTQWLKCPKGYWKSETCSSVRKNHTGFQKEKVKYRERNKNQTCIRPFIGDNKYRKVRVWRPWKRLHYDLRILHLVPAGQKPYLCVFTSGSSHLHGVFTESDRCLFNE